MGEGHLEHVVVGQTLSLDINLNYNFQHIPYQLFTLLGTESTWGIEEQKEEFTYQNISPPKVTIQEQTLRGPPVHI